MIKAEVINYLEKKLNFSEESIKKLVIYENLLLDYNRRYNLIAKSTETHLWERHILDSAQIVEHLPASTKEISDLGSGAGLPGVILSIYDLNNTFHVKLYEKSKVKRQFLKKVLNELDLNFEVKKNVYDDAVVSDVIVARAFKKLPEIIKISREIIKNPHKLIILKGKDAQSAINKVSMTQNYSYKVHKSVTDIDSKILIIDKK